MATGFLDKPFSAYQVNEIPLEDEELTHVGPGTPAGEYFRRFWLPVALTEDLGDLPLRIRILTEDLVIFRDLSGATGLLQLHCSHRGTSLEFGQICQHGIRCCYHGWLFDVDGKVLDTPGEPPDSTYKDRLYHGAYPTRELKGMIFAYMGPEAKEPPFTILDTFDVPGMQLLTREKNVFHCNWLQVEDNIMDPVHTTFLHSLSTGVQFTEAFDNLPQMDFMESPIGMVYIATRRVGDKVWVRMNDSLLPTPHQFNRNEEDASEVHPFWPAQTTEWSVPIDDRNTLQMAFKRIPEGQEPRRSVFFGQTPDRPYEERQRIPGDYDAMVGQRPIAVHDLEHLGATDRGVIMLRKLIRDDIRAVQAGGDPVVLSVKAEGPVPTYSNDTIIVIPPAPTLEEDMRLLRDTGRRMAREYFENHPRASEKSS